MNKILLVLCCLLSLQVWSQKDTAQKLQQVVIRCGVPKNDILIGGNCSGLHKNDQPLFVLDGGVIDSATMRSIKPELIEKIHVLKNPEATALYGSAAINGVILITSKQLKDLKLQVLDEVDNLPVVSATLKLAGGKKEKSFRINKEGLVHLPNLSAGKEYSIEVTCVGYTTQLQKIKFDSSGAIKTVYLKRAVKKMDEVKIVSYGTISRRCGGCRLKCTRIYHYNLLPNTTAKFSFSIYPNPAQRAQTISILPKQKINGSYQVIAASGTAIKAGQINADEEQPFSVNTSNWLPGTYFVRLTDISGKQVTEKFILQ